MFYLLPIVVFAQNAKLRFKIDAHYHYQNTPDFIPQTVKNCRDYNMMVCVLTPFDALDRMSEAVKQYPDVFIGFGSVSLDDPQALEKIDSFHRAGFKGIGELSGPHHNFDDQKYFPIYERIQLYGMVALFHTGIVARRNPEIPQYSSMARMRPAYLDAIARRFPKLTILGAHLGNPWYDEAAEALRWNPNLYFDITGSSLLKKAEEPQYWGKVLWWRPSLETRHSPNAGQHAFEKIIFSTDEGPEGLVPNIERFERVLEANNVPEAVREKCWSGTFAKILGITRKNSGAVK